MYFPSYSGVKLSDRSKTAYNCSLAIEFRAKDFFRGAEADGIRLFDVVG